MKLRFWRKSGRRPAHKAPVRTTARYGGMQERRLRHTFGLLQQEYRLLKRESYGDDIDALVESFADVRSGLEASERVFARTARAERNVAVIFMLDMSASTAGWINRVEREALVLLCEALEALDDRYAIYGFSGRTRAGCRAYRIKTFDEEYSETVKARIGVHPFCVTIDRRARDYVPHMFGGTNFAVIDQVEKLPARVGDIYRRLTT